MFPMGWDVLRCCRGLCVGKEAWQKGCRGNTGSNRAARHFMWQAKGSMAKHGVWQPAAGGPVAKGAYPDLA